MITIVIKNLATVVTDAQVQTVIPALQKQLSRDLAPAWGLGQYYLDFREKGAPVAKGEQLFLFLDKTDDASALGYHDKTATGDAITYVGVKETMDDGGQWTVTASHELCEMAVNPGLNDCEFNAAQNRIDIKEVCDAVEADELGYRIDGVQVSDFVLPAWFESDESHSAKLSFCGHVSRPFELAPGGYISFVDLAQPSKGWQQTFADHPARAAARKRPGTSRGAIRARVKASGTARRSVAQ